MFHWLFFQKNVRQTGSVGNDEAADYAKSLPGVRDRHSAEVCTVCVCVCVWCMCVWCMCVVDVCMCVWCMCACVCGCIRVSQFDVS